MSTPPDHNDGLSNNEAAYLRGEDPTPEQASALIERRRPGWLVVGMVWATFGLYLFFWVGLHWAEMKRQLKDEKMYPVWHSVSMLVPIYSYFRFHANFRVMNELLQASKSPVRVQPLLPIGTFLLASLIVTVPIEDTVLLTLNMAGAMVALSWILHYGQTSMNAYWDATPDVKITSEVKTWEKALVFIGAFLWWMILSGMILELLG